MKVTLEKGYKDVYTVSDVERARRVIEAEREDEETPAGWLEYAAREALRNSMYDSGYVERVIEATARTARNSRAWNAYGEGTENMDVWVGGIAKVRTGKGDDAYIEVGAYLSDIWLTGSVDYREHIYSRLYIEARN